MNRLKLVGAFVKRQPLAWGFQALTLALGVAVLTAVLTLDAGLSGRFQRDLAGIDLVVGAKGSPLQIILSSVFQLDQPTGNNGKIASMPKRWPPASRSIPMMWIIAPTGARSPPC